MPVISKWLDASSSEWSAAFLGDDAVVDAQGSGDRKTGLLAPPGGDQDAQSPTRRTTTVAAPTAQTALRTDRS